MNYKFECQLLNYSVGCCCFIFCLKLNVSNREKLIGIFDYYTTQRGVHTKEILNKRNIKEYKDSPICQYPTLYRDWRDP